MAAVAQIGGGRVTAGFGRTHAAAHVTTHTLVGGGTVVERRDHRQPLRGPVAGIAGVVGQWMIAGFAVGQVVVVTGRALGRTDLRMIDKAIQWQPGLLTVAAVAQIGGGRMSAGFGGADTAAYVATHALIAGFIMVKWD